MANFSSTHNMVMRLMLDRFQLRVEDVPSWEEDEEAALNYVAPLSRDFMRYGMSDVASQEALYRCEPRSSTAKNEEGEEVEMGGVQATTRWASPFNAKAHETPLVQELVCFFSYDYRFSFRTQWSCLSILGRLTGRDLARVAHSHDTPRRTHTNKSEAEVLVWLSLRGWK
jgi:hypothetical protein